MEDYFSEAVNFIKGITKNDSVIIIFNNDADGISACVLIDTLLKSKGVKPYIISQPMPTEKNLVRKIQTTIPTKIIFLDLAMDQQQAVIKRLAGMCDILIIDHHSIHNNLNTPSVVHHNPRFRSSEIYQSATYLAYKITSQMQDMRKYLWIAAVGMIGDYNLDYSSDVVEEVQKAYPKVTGKAPLYESFLGRLADMIASSRAMNAVSCEEMVRVFEEAGELENFDKTEGSAKLKEADEIIRNEFSEIEKDMEKNAETHGGLVMYELKSRHNLCSPVSTKMSERYKGKLLMIYQKASGKYHASGRNQDKRYDVATIFNKAARGLKGAAGGHPAAAGATIAESDWETFKERLIKAMESRK